MCRAGVWFVSLPETLRSSTATVPEVVATSVVSLWIASVRGFATRVWIRVTSRRGRFPAGRGGCCPVRRSGPTRRDNVPEAVRSAFTGSVQVSWVGHRLTGAQHGQSP